ncbi:MAG TPA: leucine zipper domain-containing protein [Rhodothermales bacterium]|nr:leucine zipper domain-containing protein [Rhodothermales bacterium]
MPWKETGRVLERTRFIDDYLTGCFTISELASRYGVSRKTLYKWLARHDAEGLVGLADRSRAPIESPQRTPVDVVDEIVAFKHRFPFMGPKKIISRLQELKPEIDWPAASTAHEILRREGLVDHRHSPPSACAPRSIADES